MNVELLRRGEQNIEDAAFVRDHFIPTATKSQRWNIVVYEAFLTIELIVKGMICLSGNKPDKNHDVHHLVDQFHKLLPDEINSQPFLYSAASPSGHAYGIYSDGRSIQLLKKVHGVYTSMASVRQAGSIDQLLLLRLGSKDPPYLFIAATIRFLNSQIVQYLTLFISRVRSNVLI